MTNTLTWDIKPIVLPKINSNLLSVISLILLLTMAFLTVAVIANDCDELKKKLDAAGEALKDAFWDYLEAEIAFYAALLSGDALAILKAGKDLVEAADKLEDARRTYTSLLAAYQEFCLKDDNNQSGSCG